MAGGGGGGAWRVVGGDVMLLVFSMQYFIHLQCVVEI